MPAITLQHCIPVTIYDGPAGQALLALTVGGAKGDGQVDVVATPLPATPPACATGSSDVHHSPSCGHLVLHYRSATGTGSVGVSYTLTVA